ncbi:MAG: hypothetical protein ACPG6B_04820 [Oceanihabitans sp.]
MKIKLLVALLLVAQLAVSQNYQTIEEVDDACSQLGFNSDEDAEIAVDNILDQIGLFRNFTIQECPNINNAVAKNIEVSPGQKERYILYDANFFDKIETKANNRWAAISVLAHEIGHHLNGHSLNDEGSNHKFELEADYFSGLALAKMGASKAEAQSAIMTIRYEKATRTHPAKADRLIAIENGWNKAKGISNKKTVKEENEDTAFAFYQKGEEAFQDHDFTSAISYFNKAKDLDYKDAYYYLSHIYYTGIGTKVDYKKAYKYAKQGYDLGSIPSTYQLGKYLANGTGVNKSKSEANRLFQKSFQIKWFKDQYRKNQFAFHAYAIAYMYSNGYGGVQEDQEIALLWYKQAAEGGSLTGMGNLAVQYETGEGVPVDKYKATQIYRKAADLGHPNSMSNLGVSYENGNGVSVNIEQSIYWYKKACEYGSPEGYKKLGRLYIDGEKVTQDVELGLSYYKKALVNFPSLYTTVGNIYYRGTGINKDPDLAFYYFKEGAKRNDPSSLGNTGYCYDEGIGTAINWETALDYYQKAADLGNAYSIRKLGEFYYFGVGGVSQNKYKGIRLFEEAAALDDDTAKSHLEVIRNINNRRYITVKAPRYGNKLYISAAEIAEEYPAYPYNFSAHSGSWSVEVNYQLGSDTQAVQIFPIKENEYPDDLFFTNYTPCAPLYDSSGSHVVSTSIKTISEGYRAIKYVYYRGTFYDNDGDVQEQVIIKAPVALCWLPE